MTEPFRRVPARWAVLPVAFSRPACWARFRHAQTRAQQAGRLNGARLAWAGVVLLILATSARAAGWRGDGSGLYPQAAPPTQWDSDEGKNILWKAEIGKGQSSPVAAGERIFITAEPALLLALDLKTGKCLWQKENGYASLPPGTQVPARPPPTVPGCGYATPTPVTDGKFVYASFGTGVVACYDLEGNRRWIRHLDLPQASEFGRAASPILAGGKLLVSIGGLEALDPATGDLVWQAPEAKPTFATPAVARIGDADVAITPNGDCVRVSDGKLLARKLFASTYTTPVVGAGVVYCVGPPAVAVKLPAKAADGFQPEKLWQFGDLEGEFFASPVLLEGLLYGAGNDGTFYVLDAATGKLVYKKELPLRSAGGKPGTEPANLYPSLTLAGKHLLVGNDEGETLVLAPGREYKEVARCILDKGSGASPAPDGKVLLLRAGKRLYSIGEK